MSGTFSQVHIQVVFAVRGRQNLLRNEWREELFSYMAGIIRNKEQKPIIINVRKVYNYIFNQEEHHRRKTFKEEYIDLLKEFEIPYDEKYLFDWVK